MLELENILQFSYSQLNSWTFGFIQNLFTKITVRVKKNNKYCLFHFPCVILWSTQQDRSGGWHENLLVIKHTKKDLQIICSTVLFTNNATKTFTTLGVFFLKIYTYIYINSWSYYVLSLKPPKTLPTYTSVKVRH